MSLFVLELKEELTSFFRIQKNFEQLEKFKGPKKCITLSWIVNQLETCKDKKLYKLYKGQYIIFLKKYFDVFGRGQSLYLCRRTRKIFEMKGKNCNRIETSLCQLNFLRFVIQNNVLKKLNVSTLKKKKIKKHKLIIKNDHH